MRKIIILSLFIICLGCKTERINRQLRLSKKHMDRAIFLGGNIDSIKTTVKATGEVGEVKESETTTAKLDTAGTVNACAELLSSLANVTSNQRRVIDSLKNLPKPKVSKPFKDIQKAVCPDDSIHLNHIIPITVGGMKYEIPLIINAYSKGGKAGFSLEVKKSNFEYTVKTVQVNATPGNIPSWWQKLGTSVLLFIAGVIVGAVGIFITGLFKKVVTIGK